MTTMLTLIKLMANLDKHLVFISFHFHSENTIKFLCCLIKTIRRHIFNINSIQSHLKVLLICIIGLFKRFQIVIVIVESIFNIFKSILQ
jgi:hypothetical protein